MSHIFLSYRRSESADVAGRIYDSLVAEFSRDGVFKDVDSIPISVPFRNYIRDALENVRTVVVVIGPTWATITGENGRPRLEDPKDFVRMEVEMALRLGIPTIPITVSNAGMPEPRDLPEALRELCNRNGQPVRPDPDYHRDIGRLVSRLRAVLGLPTETIQDVKPADSSLAELEQILKGRAIRVEEWFRDQQARASERTHSSPSEYGNALTKFRTLHKQHVEALLQKQFVLAHEILGEIHELLGRYDASHYFAAPEYGYEYPGTLDADDLYSVLKHTDASFQAPLIKSLFRGMISREVATMQANSFFQFTLSVNTGVSLARAVCEQDLAMLQALLDAGFHPDIRVTSKIEQPRGVNSTPLMFAAHNGNVEIVEELLCKGAKIDATNEDGQTAGQVARDAGNTKVAVLLGSS